MSKGYATTTSTEGQWTRVRCSIAELDERECRFTIVGTEKETLQHCLNVRLLRTTDIRFADRSLFFRNDCLSIHSPAQAFYGHSPSLQTLLSTDPAQNKRTHPAPALDPIYLAFESKEAANTWTAALRSYAVPEIYGCELEPRGLFRMWRQVSLSITTARHLALARKNSNSSVSSDLNSNGTGNSNLISPEDVSDAAADLQLYCEVEIDGVAMGRTALQKGTSEVASHDSSPLPTWTWLESFVLSDLPPFGLMGVRIWRFKKGAKPIYVGVVEVVLGHIRKGQAMDGWFPILNGTQVGELRMKLKVDEERILPSEAYSGIIEMVAKNNPLDLMGELDQKLRLQEMSQHMLALSIARGTFLADILKLAEREVDHVPNPNTLFRGNSVFTKTVEQIMTFFGRPFLEASVGYSIHELVIERVELETDPRRNQKGTKDVENSIKLLQVWCEKFWKRIWDMREHCPPELRKLFQSIRELVEKKFGDREDVVNLKWQSVSAFAFLRLIVPAILYPHLWGLHPGLPSPSLQRSLTLIAKALQSLANLSKEKKEAHMHGVSQFLEDNRSLMIKYIQYISSPSEQPTAHIAEHFDRTRIRRYLRERAKGRTETPLHVESLPALPHFLDLQKHLAIVSSAVTRHTRMAPQFLTPRPIGSTQDTIVEDFAVKCFEIEGKISHSVTRLRANLSPTPAVARSPLRGITSRNSSSPGSSGGPEDAYTGIPIAGPSRQSREIQRSSKAAGKRPSTAPAGRSSSTDSSSAKNVPLPSSPPLLRALRGKASNDSGVSSPPLSPMSRGFSHQLSTSVSFSTDHSFTSGTVGDTDNIPDPLSSSQQLMDTIDPNKRKKFFSRPGFLGRNQKASN
ncbi:hypothetical protein M422DRAFT_216095 [Sphaerobolus stellatus SS14]|uniref:Ras-GAP domain-containing protein n=1 Tax=Sphaerobolus stellatus (strain SS14) TaxID=990650 RepID=A0A0C9UCS8_SPHS4|nr:hypothetical protein M422DRAFT_216095 [Sphaerobolus stellatus SS14]